MCSDSSDRLTNGSSTDINPRVNDAGDIVWQHWDGSFWQIQYSNGTTTTLTSGSSDHTEPQINNAVTPTIVWQGWNITGGHWDIYKSSNGGAATQVSTTSGDSVLPQVNDNNYLTWQSWVNNNWEIYYNDTVSTRQLSSNTTDDVLPQINNNNNITWQNWLGNNWQIDFYNGSTITPITTDATDHVAPRLNNSDQIAWAAWNGTSWQTFRYAPGQLTSVTLSPNPILGGATSTGTVQWTYPVAAATG